MKKLSSMLILFYISFLCGSCEYRYDPEDIYKPMVVVNSILNPDSTIKIQVVWSNVITDIYRPFKVVDKFEAEIFEDNKLIYKGDCTGGELKMDTYPKEGSNYSLKINVPDYGEVSAETRIPIAPDAEVVSTEQDVSYDKFQEGFIGIIYYRLNSVKPKDRTLSLLIKKCGLYENGYIKESRRFRGNNQFADDFNHVIVNSTSNRFKGFYEKYIRIPYKNIDHLVGFEFGADTFGNRIPAPTEDNRWNTIHVKNTFAVIQVIAPSDEYDKYLKTKYRQQNSDVVNPPIFNQTTQIHTNIKGGVGIFAGYSSRNIRFNPDDYVDK